MSTTQGMLRDDALKGKNILITGGGTGLGKAMTRYFLQLGAQCIITSRKDEIIQQTATELSQETNGRCIAIACDVRDYDQVEKVIHYGIQELGSIDVLVNNAAGNFISPTERLSHRAFESVLGIVLQGTINCTLALGKIWIANKDKDKTVLNIVTTYASTGSGYVVPSACAKSGVLAMTRSLAVEWGRKGIRLNAIAPGPFHTTGAFDRLFPSNLSDTLNPINRIPLARTGNLQELANLAAYLVSDYSAYINGDVITIDGGEWLKGAGEFNGLDAVTEEQWDVVEKLTRGAKST